MIPANKNGISPYTLEVSLLYGFRVAARILVQEVGLGNFFRRHALHAEAPRRPFRARGVELLCFEPAEHSNSLTAITIMLLEGFEEAGCSNVTSESFDISLSAGFGKLAAGSSAAGTSATRTTGRSATRSAASRGGSIKYRFLPTRAELVPRLHALPRRGPTPRKKPVPAACEPMQTKV